MADDEATFRASSICQREPTDGQTSHSAQVRRPDEHGLRILCVREKRKYTYAEEPKVPTQPFQLELDLRKSASLSVCSASIYLLEPLIFQTDRGEPTKDVITRPARSTFFSIPWAYPLQRVSNSLVGTDRLARSLASQCDRIRPSSEKKKRKSSNCVGLTGKNLHIAAHLFVPE